MKCPYCGAELPQNAAICAACGAKIGQAAYPSIPCESCGEMLVPASETEGVCPACGKKNLPRYVYKELYQRGASLKPLQIQWEPENEELVHIDPQSDAIPLYSVVVVQPNQEALYRTAGRTVLLAAGGTYPLFTDPRTEEDVIKSANYDPLSVGLKTRLNTKIIFFDKRRHHLKWNADYSLLDGHWEACVPIEMDIWISDPEALMRNGLDFSREKETARQLYRFAQTEIEAELRSRLLTLPKEKIFAASTEAVIKSVLLGELGADETDEIRRIASMNLAEHYGLSIEQLIFHFSDGKYRSHWINDEVVCPKCGAANWIKKNSRQAFECASCGEALSWCMVCHRFTPSKKSSVDGSLRCVYDNTVKIPR